MGLLLASIGFPFSVDIEVAGTLALVRERNAVFSVLSNDALDADGPLSDLLVTLETVLIPDLDVEQLVLVVHEELEAHVQLGEVGLGAPIVQSPGLLLGAAVDVHDEVEVHGAEGLDVSGEHSPAGTHDDGATHVIY